MNKLFTRIAIATAGIAMAIGVGVLSRNSVSTASTHAVSSTLAMSAVTSSDSNISATAAKSTGQNAPITATVNSQAGVRLYANNTLTITSSNNITALTIPFYANGTKVFASVTANVGTYTHASSSGSNGTWSGSAKEIVLTVGSSGQIQLYQIQYETSGEGGGGETTNITLNSTNWPVTATGNHTDAQTSTLDGIVYENVGSYIYSSKLSINYHTNNYFGNKTAFPKNIQKIVVTYSANVTSYVKMYESDEPLTKTTLVASSGTTTVTYTFSDTNPYFRLNMDTSTPSGTYCNITSIVITLGSAAEVVDLTDISLNENKTIPAGLTFASELTKIPANANNKDTIAWTSSNTGVATVDSEGVVTAVSAGVTTITATASDLSGVSASYQLTVFATTNDIEKAYYRSNGDALDLYGYYVGFATGTGPIIMNGEYGIVIYNSSHDVSGYTENETILHVTGKLSIFSGLYEVSNSSISTAASASDLSAPVVYTVTGDETYIHESRSTLVSGTVKSVSGSWTTDTTIIVTVGTKDIQCFAKANAIDAETGAKIVADADVTLTGFTGWHNGFQVSVTGLVETGSYTLDQFISDFLSLTATECGKSGDDHKDGLQQNVWNVLNTAEKYGSLSVEDKEALRTTSPEAGSDLEKALERYDFLVGKYFGKAGDFLGRNIDFANANALFGINTTDSMAFILVVAIASLVALSAIVVIRKKKQAR